MGFDKMDQTSSNFIGSAAKDALQQALEPLGVTVTRTGGTYDPDAGTLGIKFTFKLANADPQEKVDFLRYEYRFPAYKFGAQFTSNGKEYTLAGYRPRASKRPFVGHRIPDGKAFVFGWETLTRELGNKEKV
jgi:hypothetical protein